MEGASAFPSVTSKLSVAVQPLPSVTVTEYVPAAVAVICGAVEPFDHKIWVKSDALAMLNPVEPPTHITLLPAICGRVPLLTVTATWAVPVPPAPPA